MQVIQRFCLFAIILTAASACFNPPDFPVTPQIEFESVQYKEVGTGTDSKPDSIILIISFKDGDGDLGLAADETGCVTKDICYNSKFYFIKPNKKPVTYKDKRTDPNFSSFPALSCTNWEEVKNDKNAVTDTLYFELNPNHYNIEVDFLIKNQNGTFTEFDLYNEKEFAFPNCPTTFDSRFPILFKDQLGSPLEGKIRYALKSSFFKIFFTVKTLKLRVQIKDRALNKSNIVETSEFTLQ